LAITRKDLRFLGGAGILVILLTVLVGTVARLGPVVELERRIDDAAIAHFASGAVEPHPAVAVVAIDEATIRAYPPFSPIDREMLAHLLTILQAAAPRAIGLDILLADPTGSAADQRLADVLSDSPVPVVIATALKDGRRLALAAPFDVSEISSAVANLPVDRSDDVLRLYQPGFSDVDGTIHPTLAFRLVEAATGVQANLSDDARPIDWYGRPSVRETGSPAIATFPAHTFLSVPAAANLIRGKIVLIGTTFAANSDFVKTPFSRLEFDGAGIPGVMAHAQILAQLIDGRVRAVPSAGLRWLLITGALVLSAALAMARPSAVIAILLAAGVPVLWIILGLYVRRETGFPLPALPPALAFGAGVGAFSAYQARRLDQMQRQALRALAQRVPAGVIDQMIASPDLLNVDGDARVVTVIFTDLASFTRFSSERTAPEVMRFLRDYLEEVSETVLEHDGTIDKFIGDAVMAFWGAPLDQPDHARRAIACARDLDAKCRRIAGQHGIVTRIGVHTGEAMAGFVGSRKRLEYTVIGDTVNTASRVEGANKYLRTTLCVTGETIAAAGQDSAALGLRFVARVRLSGRDEPVALYTTIPDGYDRETTGRYAEAATTLDDGEFERARSLFDCVPVDAVVEFQLERCRLGPPVVVSFTDK